MKKPLILQNKELIDQIIAKVDEYETLGIPNIFTKIIANSTIVSIF